MRYAAINCRAAREQQVQEALNNFRAQITTESEAVSAKYEILVTKTREVAGTDIHDAWEAPPLENDAGMNITHLDYAELKQPEEDYFTAVKTDVSLMRLFVGAAGDSRERPSGLNGHGVAQVPMGAANESQALSNA